MAVDPPTALPGATRTRYGATHPEKVENPLWEQAIREEWTGYGLRQHLAIELHSQCAGYDFSQSAYRDTTPGPFWSWQRFGRTSTPLPDGRIIHIAGEHEDSYDPDFCIYNDVVVEHPDGRREFYLYPREVFPPTDFHTATLVGRDIILIGSLGYHDLLRAGETQVLKLDTDTLRFETLATRGEGPGWISRHTAEKVGEAVILVAGGNVATPGSYQPNAGLFELDLSTLTWRRRQHGDVAIFPVSAQAYAEHKNPRFGSANPERSRNPFWHEMVRREWTPSRARLHFGDFAPPRPELVLPEDDEGAGAEYGTPEAAARMERINAAIERTKLKRSISDVIWTAVRENALTVRLPDGRDLLIGGEVPDYGDEYADPWIYNDIVVTHQDGTIEILTYPEEVFPQLYWPVEGVSQAGALYIFGMLNRSRNPASSRAPVILRLDTTSYEIKRIYGDAPAARVDMFSGSAVLEGSRVVFSVMRMRESDPVQRIAFDLETLTWGEPGP